MNECVHDLKQSVVNGIAVKECRSCGIEMLPGDDVTAPPWMPEFRAALEANDVAKMADILKREMGRIGRRL
jgi:hypothetical protein